MLNYKSHHIICGDSPRSLAMKALGSQMRYGHTLWKSLTLHQARIRFSGINIIGE